MKIVRAYDYGGEVDWPALAERMGETALRRRIEAQNIYHTSAATRQRRYLQKELVKHCADLAFQLCGLSGIGRRNFRNIQVVDNPVILPNLPAALDGLRLLQLSDLHIDLELELADVIAARLAGLDYDLAVITGDFRNLNWGDFTAAMQGTRTIVEALERPVYGILGNHDDLEMAVWLEQMGVRMLLNESVPVDYQGHSFWLSGIDDPHHYRTHDISRCLERIPAESFKVLLSHSPETYQQAAESGYHFFLCGHTHGGQICLPGGVPVITRSDSPRWCSRGNWQFKGMHGYTTTGTGGCGAALRLNCPPEIVIHELRAS